MRRYRRIFAEIAAELLEMIERHYGDARISADHLDRLLHPSAG
jgi:hypothetical protein